VRHRHALHLDGGQEFRKWVAAHPLHHRLPVAQGEHLGPTSKILLNGIHGAVRTRTVNGILPRLRHITRHQVRLHILDHARDRHVKEVGVPLPDLFIAPRLSHEFVDTIDLEPQEGIGRRRPISMQRLSVGRQRHRNCRNDEKGNP